MYRFVRELLQASNTDAAAKLCQALHWTLRSKLFDTEAPAYTANKKLVTYGSLPLISTRLRYQYTLALVLILRVTTRITTFA